MLQHCPISGFADEIDDSLDVQIEVLKQLGQKYLEFRSAEKIGVANYTEDAMRAVKTKLDTAGLQVSALGSPIGKIGILDDFEPHFEIFRNVITLASILNTRFIRMFSFYIPEGGDPEVYADAVSCRLERLIAYAKEQDVVLLHENEKGIYGDTIERCRKLMEKHGCEHFRCVFDFANFVQCKQDPIEAYEVLKPYIAYIHVKDALWESADVVPPGMGDGKLAQIFSRLDTAGYAGFLSLEPHLANFSTLASLEREAVTHKMQNGIDAYRIAHEKLLSLLA